VTSKTCETCLAFQAYGDGSNRGECRRRAPTMSSDTDLNWPIVAQFDWCCDWLKKARPLNYSTEVLLS
jgi:hypothetical protein